jgi:hypothetical protein
MSESSTELSNWQTNNKKNTLRLGIWTGAWVVSTAVLTFGSNLLWNFETLPTVIAAIANLVIGFGMIFANGRHLRGLDELQQKIFLEAGALTLGVGLVCGMSYEMLEQVKLITFEPEISHLVILMCLTFMVGMIAGHRKYK